MQLIDQTALDLTSCPATEQTTERAAVEQKSTAVTRDALVENVPNWSRAFNTSILSTSIESKSLDHDLEALLATPEYAAILLAAQSISEKLQLTPEIATERLIQTFRSIDLCWEKILLKKGAQSLLGL